MIPAARFSLAALFCAVSVLSPAGAQNYPLKPIRVIIPGAAGAPTDIAARAIGESFRQSAGQPFIVDNRVAANGIVGMEACARAAPDGYTLCVTPNAPVSINPFLYAKLPYDPPHDYAPVIQIGVINAAVLINPSLPVTTLRELIDLSKSKPGVLNWASWSPGSASHLYLGWLQSNTGAAFTHVPYKTPDQAVNALVTGEAHAMGNAAGLMVAQIKAGKLKALAITGPKRASFLPDVPTFQEQGYDLRFRGWGGMFAPTGVSREIVQWLNAEVNKLLADPKFVAKALTPFSMEPTGGSPEEFAAFLKTDREVGAALVKAAGLKPE